jgi:hypothetical protein
LQILLIIVYICTRNHNKKKMKIKTVENPKKAGRPQGEPTSVISVRIPTALKKEVDERFGIGWQGMFKDFIKVYLMDRDSKI